MPTSFASWSDEIRRLDASLERLIEASVRAGVPPPRDQEWHETLKRKLLPQASADATLVVAVVGGTNVGKSAVFNQIAGEAASAVCPMAAGTRHSVLLVSDEKEMASLAGMFEGFELACWQSAADPLQDGAAHRLFWRQSPAVPPRLLVLDTPDIDSDAPVNWQRADHVRHVADVLVAVLTQQKYNDAAVKQFFRKAAAVDKAVVVVFNQCHLEEDRPFWPQWLATFASETGVRPERVYVAPYDRAGAKGVSLPFFEVGPDGKGPLGVPHRLRDDLAEFDFDEMKIRSLRGAMGRVTDAVSGAPAYLRQIREASAGFNAAASVLAAHDMARVDWPALPTRLLVDEIRAWWDESRTGWSRKIHGFYRQIGQVVARPVRMAWEKLQGVQSDPLDAFHRNEREAVVQAVEKLVDELERLASVGNDVLRPRLERLLSGESRAVLLSRVTEAHGALAPVDPDYREFLRSELDQWSQNNPRVVTFLRSLDHAAAIARPAITVSLAVSGWFLAGGLVHEAAAHVAGHTAAQIMTEVAITGTVAAGGEVAVEGAGDSLKLAAARLFSRLQERYANRRAMWLAQWLEGAWLGGLLSDLREGAGVPTLVEFKEVEELVGRLKDEG
jgi:hypothetical protein